MDNSKFYEWQQEADNFVNIVSLYEYDKCIDWCNKCNETCSKLDREVLMKMDFQDLMKKAGCWEEYTMAKKIKDLEEKMNKLESDF
jgi:chromosome segregation ATPase